MSVEKISPVSDPNESLRKSHPKLIHPSASVNAGQEVVTNVRMGAHPAALNANKEKGSKTAGKHEQQYEDQFPLENYPIPEMRTFLMTEAKIYDQLHEAWRKRTELTTKFGLPSNYGRSY